MRRSTTSGGSDGEVVVFDEQLVSRFEWLRHLNYGDLATPPVYMVFDLLRLGEADYRLQRYLFGFAARYSFANLSTASRTGPRTAERLANPTVPTLETLQVDADNSIFASRTSRIRCINSTRSEYETAPDEDRSRFRFT
jgi:hypothetical protein